MTTTYTKVTFNEHATAESNGMVWVKERNIFEAAGSCTPN